MLQWSETSIQSHHALKHPGGKPLISSLTVSLADYSRLFYSDTYLDVLYLQGDLLLSIRAAALPVQKPAPFLDNGLSVSNTVP